MIDRRLVLLGLPALLAGCGGAPPAASPTAASAASSAPSALSSALSAIGGLLPSGPPKPPVLALALTGSADQNPDPAGNAKPVAVRLYQLTATGRFEQADVFALIDYSAQTLGDQLVGSESLILTPGQSLQISRKLAPTAQFLGVVVLFRDIDQAKWRLDTPLAPHGPTKLALHIAGITATLTPG